MAGLGEACTHIAALLFAIEASVKLRDSKTVTEEKTYWLLPTSNKAESSFSVGSGILDLYVAAPFGVQELLFDVAHKSSLQSNFLFSVLVEVKSISLHSLYLTMTTYHSQ
jgi:hypothetical protein